MNALTRATTTLPRVAGQRYYSKQIVDKIKNKPVWLSDVATYPVIGICAFALVGSVCYMNYLMIYHPDVRWDKNKRGSVLRIWPEKKIQN